MKKGQMIYSIKLWTKSVIFNAGLYTGLSVSFFIGRFFIGKNPRRTHTFFIGVNKYIHKWLTFCIGVDLKVYNKENILKEPAIYAIRHESTWETFVLMSIIPNVCFVLKAELSSIPLFGGVMKRLKMIKVNRKDGMRAVSIMASQAEDRLKDGSNVVIFPEGTRMPSGQFSKIHPGIYAIYRKTGAKVIPVALNSGKVWPRRTFLKYPGCIKIKFMPPIDPGLSKAEFMPLLEERIKIGTTSLLK